jgi:Tripartite tricarboxylate transporter TctB family
MFFTKEAINMAIKSQKDFFSGVLFTAVGVAFAWGATNYSVGTGARMGPGYFPLILGICMAILGGIITFKALVVEPADGAGDKIGTWAWKPLFFIIAANLIFGLLLGGLPSIKFPAFGLIAAIFALTFVASLAGDEFNFKEVTILAVVLSIMSYAAFILLLKLQFPVWPTFLTN